MAVLVRSQGTHKGKWVYPVGQRCVLGRHAECDVSDLFVDNAGVSRFHALVECVGGRYFLEDKGSRNGTLLNGAVVAARTPLRSGDRLLIAGVELTFLEEAVAAGTSAPPPPAPPEGVSFAEPENPQRPIASMAVGAPTPTGPLPGYSGDKLRALVKMLTHLGRSLNVNETLGELLRGLFAIFPQAQRGFAAFTEDGEDVTPRATHFHREEGNPSVGISRTLVRHVLSRREAVLWANQDPNPELAASYTLNNLQIHSLMCAPLLDGDGNPFGVVQIDTDEADRPFTALDLEVMVGAVSQAAVAVRFAKLHEEALQRQAVERDLELGRRVQMALLPEGYPDYEGFEFFAHYRAAYEVGGDYFDFIELPNRRLALVVADAAGKGVSAALLMAKLSGELKYYLSCEPPGAAVARMNDSLCNSDTGRFVTLLVAIQDRQSPALTLLNAGHPAPLRRRAAGGVEVVGEAARGPALGLLPGQQYQAAQAVVEPGDVWLAYTDGFTEALNARGEMFGAARLCARLARAPAVVREAGEQIVREVVAFLGDQPQSDDMCLLGWGRPQGVGGAGGRTGEVCAVDVDSTKTKADPPRR